MVRWISSSLARLYRPSNEEDHVGEDSPFFVFIETISLARMIRTRLTIGVFP
jgi:hypothetical protein